MNKLLLTVFVLLCVVYMIECAKPSSRQGSSHWEASLRRYMERRKHKAKMVADKKEKQEVKRMFRPTIKKCCKLGEKVARKRLSCSADIHRVSKNKNLLHKTRLKMAEPEDDIFSLKLTIKIAKCGAHYPKYFEKCCRYGAHLMQEIDDCRRMRVRGSKDDKRFERRKCKKTIRQKFQ